MLGGGIVKLDPVVCVGPVKYQGAQFLQTDITNVKAAAKAGPPGVSSCHRTVRRRTTNITSLTRNTSTLAEELGKEYAAIVDSGILVQIDDPFLPDIFFEPGLDDAQKRRRAQIYVEATNTALRGIPADRVRFHTCYGINEGPRIYEAALSDIIAYVLKINAGSFSFEAANPRHEHEYHLSVNCHLPALKGIKYAGFAGRTYVVRRPLSGTPARTRTLLRYGA